MAGLLVGAVGPTASQAQIYVDADATGADDGTSWADAYTDLQDALQYVKDNDPTDPEIWIAAGTYTPVTPADPNNVTSAERETSFTITGREDGLEIYGGFDGTDGAGGGARESSRGARDPDANEVVLSGDIDGDDDPFEPNVDSDNDDSTPTQVDHLNGSNSHRVVLLDGGNHIGDIVFENVTTATLLDGVTITGGNADGGTVNNTGAAIYCDGRGGGDECSPALHNVVFEGNYARTGGALYNMGFNGRSSPQIEDATFTGNAAGNVGGGAICNSGRSGVSRPQITSTTFTNNYAEGDGGAIRNSGVEGGVGNPEITGSTFTNNSGQEGGAIYNDGRDGTSSPQITTTTFTGNSARIFGGAIYNQGTNGGTSSPRLADVTFDGNTATGIPGITGGSGGAIYNEAGTEFSGTTPGTSIPTITGSVFRNNKAVSEDNSEGSGGAIFSSAGTGTTSPVITNSSFVGNSADNGGGAIQSDARNGGTSNSRLTNVLFSGNSAGTNGGALYNLAGEDGDGNSGTSSPIITNVTFAGNTATADGGAIINDIISGESGAAQAEITNTIFYGNSAGNGGPQIYNRRSGAVPRLGYTLVEGGAGGVTNASGSSTIYEDASDSDAGSFGASTNLDQPPQFVGGSSLAGPDGTLGTADDSLQVTGGSPVLDAGTNAALDTTGNGTRDITTDLTGGPRVVDNDGDGTNDSVVDLGAYEASPSTVLPVELAGLEAEVSGEAVTLTWQTMSETGNARFEVQRLTSGPRNGSAEGRSWQTVGSVSGAGTTVEAQSYRFADEDLPYEADSLTYRLKQIDMDGTASYSDPITVDRSVVTELELLGTYPNPAQSRATVRFAVPESAGEQEVQLRLYDVMGRQVRTVQATAKAGRQQRQLRTSDLASGVYFLRLSAGGEVQTRKLTVVQ